MMTSESGSTVDVVRGGTCASSDTVTSPTAGQCEGKQAENGTTASADTSDIPVPLQCFVAGCPNNHATHSNKVFFRLPAERDRCQQWLKICKREDLIGKPASFISSYFICSNHFIKDHFKNASKTVLENLAVPTIFDTVCVSEIEQEEGNNENVEYEVVETDEECEGANGDVSSQQLCRLCGSHSLDVIYIFSSTGNSLKIASKINGLLPITVDISDHLPKQICVSCHNKLDTSKDLFEMCLRTDEHLRYLARKKFFKFHLQQ